jgi:formate dehydrogenase subunit gamma
VVVCWPAGALTGRFGRHEGTFDPGERLANVVIVVGPLVLTGAGIALTFLDGGPVFAKLARIHKWTTYIVTLFIVGHMLIAFSVLPGYRGVWGSTHLGGRVPKATARRVWPGWAERSLRTVHQGTPWTDRRVSRTVVYDTERNHVEERLAG